MLSASSIVILQRLLPRSEGRSINPLKFSAWWFLYVQPGLTVKLVHSARLLHVFCVYLKTNSDYFSTEIVFLLTETVCLLRGTN
jgi:hypothetical protein